VCHQTVSLVSRHLEAAGIPTVVIGSARDIVEQCGVSRFVFVDFPLGNPCGKPYDVAMQQRITGLALDALERAWAPGTSVQAPESWGDDGWRAQYMRVDDTNREALRLAGEARQRKQADDKITGATRAS